MVETDGLENRYTAKRYRRFESSPHRLKEWYTAPMARTVNLRNPTPPPSQLPSAIRKPPLVVPNVSHRAAQVQKPLQKEETLFWTASRVHVDWSPRRVMGLAVALAVLAAGVWRFQDNTLFAILLLFNAILLVMVLRSENTVTVAVKPEGISVNGDHLPFQTIRSFSVDHSEDRKELSLEVGSWYAPYVRLPLGNRDPHEIREVLLVSIPEAEHEVSFVDKLVQLLKL